MFDSLKKSLSLSRRASEQEGALPFGRQLLEMTWLLITRGLGPGNYHKYRLWQRDIPWHEKKGYWHYQKYDAFLAQVNPLPYRFMGRNKIVAKALLGFHGIPDPEYLALIRKNRTHLANGLISENKAAFTDFLRERTDLEKICFKPSGGAGGEGFSAAQIVRNQELQLQDLESGRHYSWEEFMAARMPDLADRDYLVENYVEQHPDLAVFNESSLNTLRVWVGKDRDESTRIVGLFLRVGRAGSLVDNRLAGGFGIAIDPDTFTTSYAVPQDGGASVFEYHPDSGVKLSGRTLPFREEVLALSKTVMDALPSTRFVGLDIAFTAKEPIVLEFNLAPNETGANVFKQSHQALLGWLIDE